MTKRIAVGFGALPDDSGNVFPSPLSVYSSNGLWDPSVWIFDDSSTRDGLRFVFRVSDDYSSAAVLRVFWATPATSGDVEFDLDYRAVGTGESIDQASAQESVNQNDTAGGSAWLLQVAELTLTGSNFAAGDLVEAELFRDGTDGGDTISAEVVVLWMEFEYTES